MQNTLSITRGKLSQAVSARDSWKVVATTAEFDFVVLGPGTGTNDQGHQRRVVMLR
jgi:hypothetical protein